MSALGFEADRGHSHVSIEGIAKRVRRIVGVGPALPFPTHAVFEQLHEFAWGIPVAIVPHVEENPSEGLTRYRPDKQRIEVVLHPATYDGLEHGDPRAAFTFLHELVHATEHSSLLRRMNVLPHNERALLRAAATHPKYMDTEWQANAGAGALLMPAAGLVALEQEHGTLTPELVAATYGSSLSAAGVRLNIYRTKGRTLL